MKDTLNIAEPVIQAKGVDLVFQTGDGPVQALKWIREPRREGDDNTVEVWLDPARAYLPVQARLSSSPSDTPLELLLEGPAN